MQAVTSVASAAKRYKQLYSTRNGGRWSLTLEVGCTSSECTRQRGREREKGNPVRFLASQRTVIECKCNNRVATYYLRKLYFVFRVVIPLHSSFQPPPLGKRSIFNPLHVLLFYSPLPPPLGLQFTFAPSYYVEVQRPPILFSSRGMKWKTGHTCVEEDDL